jgi:hypothetical protein
MPSYRDQGYPAAVTFAGMRDFTAFIFGAGSSHGTLRDRAPIVKEFGNTLAPVAPFQFPLLDQIAHHLGGWPGLGLDRLWTCVDYHAKFGSILPRAATWDCEASPQLKSALLRVYGPVCDAAADHLPDAGYTLREILDQVKNGDVLISLNYDTLVERLAKRLGKDLRAYQHQLRSDVVNFVKPHGSASWCLDLVAKTVASSHPDGAPLLESLTEDDVKRGREPLVLGVVPVKSELIQEVQEKCGTLAVFDTISRQWRGAMEAISHARNLVVVGYGFPSEDHHGRFLLSEAWLARPYQSMEIRCYELKDQWCKCVASINEVFPGASPKRVGKVNPPSSISKPGAPT